MIIKGVEYNLDHLRRNKIPVRCTFIEEDFDWSDEFVLCEVEGIITDFDSAIFIEHLTVNRNEKNSRRMIDYFKNCGVAVMLDQIVSFEVKEVVL